MTIEEIVVALEEIDFDSLPDQDLFKLSDVLKSSSSRANRSAYFRTRQRSIHDPDVMDEN